MAIQKNPTNPEEHGARRGRKNDNSKTSRNFWRLGRLDWIRGEKLETSGKFVRVGWNFGKQQSGSQWERFREFNTSFASF